MLVGVWLWKWWLVLLAASPALETATLAPGTPRFAVVAACRRGLTLLVVGSGCGAPAKEEVGVCEPVPEGVPMLEGSSEVNMVAELGETRWRACSVCRMLSRRPRMRAPLPTKTMFSQQPGRMYISSML
jgi:hypothetical protein